MKSDTGQLEPYCVEVKNFRAPIGILDHFKALYDNKAKSAPEIFHRSIEISHYWDNTVTDEQKWAIEECFIDLLSCDLPFKTTFTIQDEGKSINVSVSVQEGSGVSLSRGIGGGKPWGPFTKIERFHSNALDKIRKGIAQLQTRSARKSLLVLNIESPDGMLDSNLLHKLRDIVDRESQGAVEVGFMGHYQWVTI